MAVQLVPLAIIIIYAVITVGIANIFLKKKLGAEHFLVAGRALPVALVVAVVLGDMVGGPSTVGVCQRAFTEGISAILYPLAMGTSMIVLAMTMARRFRRLSAMTVSEVVGILFDEKTRLTTGIVIAIAYFFIGISQILAGGALLAPLLGINITLAKLIATVIFGAIIITGGLRSIALVNIIQLGFIFIGMIISLIFSLILVGGSIPAGLGRILTELPATHWQFTSRTVGTMTGEFLGTVFAIFAAQAAITGLFAAKNHSSAFHGAWLAGVFYFPVGIGFTIIGMCSRMYFGETLPFGLAAAPALMLEMHPVIAGLALCGLFAAVVSTGPLIFLAPVQIFVRDIYSNKIAPNASDRQVLFVNRLLTVILLTLGWILAVTFQEILRIQYWAFAFRAGIAVILLSLTYLGSRRISEDGAFWGLISGVAVFAVWTLSGNPFGVHVAIPSMATVFIGTLVVSRFRKRRHQLEKEVIAALHPDRDTA